MPEKQAPTIILHVPLNGEINKYVNFAHMAEERYGFNALHPRLAAQRERLARVAAAGALLEKASNGGVSGVSADEMSLEMSEGEGDNAVDSNVEMGGMEAPEKKVDRDPNSKEGLKPVKKRKMREDQYDKEDPFVDDSELAWEEQAAASKDGFFVYSGPLVPEGEKPVVERYVITLVALQAYFALLPPLFAFFNIPPFSLPPSTPSPSRHPLTAHQQSRRHSQTRPRRSRPRLSRHRRRTWRSFRRRRIRHSRTGHDTQAADEESGEGALGAGEGESGEDDCAGGEAGGVCRAGAVNYTTVL